MSIVKINQFGQLAGLVSSPGSCVNSSKNLVIIVHLYIFCARNGDHLILFFKTCIAHNQGMLP